MGTLQCIPLAGFQHYYSYLVVDNTSMKMQFFTMLFLIINSFLCNAAYMPHSKKFTQELVGKSARVHATIGASHIDRIVSESPTSSTEWSRHSIMFADAVVHFPNYDLDLLFRPKLLSSRFRARVFFFGFLACEKYYARRNEVWRICRARIQIASVCVPYARALVSFFFASRQNPLTWKTLKGCSRGDVRGQKELHHWLKLSCISSDL